MSKRARFAKFSSVEPRIQELLSFCARRPRAAIRFARKLLPFYLRPFVSDGMIKGHSEYARFMIVGRTRSGSNFLRGSLMSHSRIVVFGNIFRSQEAIHWGIPFYPQSPSALSLYQGDPVRFLETRVFGSFPRHVSAVGFKTIYPHTRNEGWEPVRSYLGHCGDLRVIHIKRRNILKTHLSLKRVQQRRGGWKDISGTGGDDGQVHLDYEDCLQAFTDTRMWEQEYDTLFQDHPKIDVLYEDLSGDYEGEMKRVQEFLGVDYQVVKPLTHKQSSLPPSRAISNYFELKEGFKGTPWEEFFAE